MLMIILGLFLWIPAVLGWGFPSCWVRKRLVSDNDLPNLDISEPLVGFVLITCFITIVNFLFPISGGIVFLALSLGWLGLGLRIKYAGFPPLDWRLIVLGVAWLFVVSLFSSDLIQNYDSGLYHIQAIKWLQENSTPFGLANLHSRLGLNSSWFVLASAIDLPFAQNLRLSYSLLPALLIWLMGQVSINSSIQLRDHGTYGRLHDLFACLTPAIFFSTALIVNFSSPSPDLPVFLLSVLLIYLALRGNSRGVSISSYQIWVLLVIAIFVVTIKISAAPLLLIPFGSLMINLRRQVKIENFFCFVSGSSLAVFVLIWLIRGVVLSGCLVYPVSFSCLYSLPWSVSRDHVENITLWIQSWSRAANQPPRQVLASWEWLNVWFVNILHRSEIWVIVFMLLLGVVIFFVTQLVSKNHPGTHDDGAMLSFVWPAVVCIAGIFYWFFTAPDIRFGAGYLWSLSFLVLSHALYKLMNSQPALNHTIWRSIQYLFIGITVLTVFFGMFRSIFRRAVQVATNPANILWSTGIPLPKFEMLYTEDNIQVYWPTNTDQCWDLALPCTPHLDNGLRMTQKADGQFLMFYCHQPGCLALKPAFLIEPETWHDKFIRARQYE